MSPKSCSILLLKDPPTPVGPILSQHIQPESLSQSSDAYSGAIHAAFSQHHPDTPLKVEYLPPLTTVFPETTLLSRAIAAGYPPKSKSSEFGHLWAFAVTSQNAVHAVEAALLHQLDPAVREAWLQIPIYCLTGATLATVKKVGFTTINPLPTTTPDGLNSPAPSFGNAAQLVDFLISFKWPTISPLQNDGHSTPLEVVSVTADHSPSVDFLPSPELWFLTGETRMKTIAEELSAHQKPFREVVVYETGPRPGFEGELSQWLATVVDVRPERTTPLINADKPTDIWLVGFSPKGIDLTMPVLKESLYFSFSSLSSIAAIRIQWGAIGPTTATRIREHLLAIDKPTPSITICSSVAVAKVPKPVALAEAIASHTSMPMHQC